METLFIEKTTPIYSKFSLKKENNETEKKIEKNDDEEIFWKTVSTFNWCEFSDKIITNDEYKTHIEMMDYSIINYNSYLIYFENKLRSEFQQQKHKKFKKLSKIENSKFLSHLVLKGKEFYNAVLKDLAFSDFIIDNNYQKVDYKYYF